MVEERPFHIGELAERTGLSRDAIRYYEALGVLPRAQRTRAGYRVYGATDVARIEFIGQAQALGLTLEETRDVLSLVDRGRDPCVHVRARLRERLEATRQQIEALRALESRLKTALRWAERTRDLPLAGCRCRIIEAKAGENARAVEAAPATARGVGSDS